MYQKLGLMFFAVLFVTAVALPKAEAASINEILNRMDEIIKEMQSLRAEFNGLSAVVGNAGPVSVLDTNAKKRLTLTVAYGETNDDIALIQKLLATDPDVYPYQVVSGFFGPKTEEGIRNFQSKFGLDPVGAVGPATTALLEAFFAKYPDDNFPSDALAQKPQVTAVSNPTPVTSPTQSSTKSSITSITVDHQYGQAEVEIRYVNANTKRFSVEGDTKSEIVDAIVDETGLSEATVLAALVYNDLEDDSSSDDYDEDDADEAIDDADSALDDAADEIDEADVNGEEVSWAMDTLDEAEEKLADAEDAFDEEDFDEAVELANEAEDLAEEASQRIGEEEDEGGEQGDSDTIESIEVNVDDGESEVTVKYEEDDDYEFTVDSDDDDTIIEEVAEELDMDEDDVEDLIEFDYGDVDSIDVTIDEEAEEAEVTVLYESGAEREFTIDETNEDDILDEIADLIDEDVDDVEGWTDFDYI